MNKNKFQVLIIVLTLTTAASGLLSAEEPVSELRLDALIESAIQKNPDIISAKAEWIASEKRIWQASSLPDPMGGYDIMGAMTETRNGPQTHRFMIEQDIPFPVKLWEKGKAASDESRAAAQRYEATRRDVVNEVKKYYYELYETDASIQAVEELKEILKKAEAIAQARYSNLSGTQRDVAKAQAEVSMVLEKMFSLKRRREIVAAMINSLLDNDPMTELGSAAMPERPKLNQSLVELVNLAVQNRQEIKEMQAMVSKSGREKTLAKLQNIPDLNVGFQYTRVGSGSTTSENDGKDSWMFPVRFNIPIWQNRIIPAIQEAGKNEEAAEAKLLSTKNKTFYEVKDAYHRFMLASENLELYETAVIPQAKLALSADQAGYEGEKTDFLNLLDSERVYLNAKLSQIQLISEMFKGYADLVRATGLDLVRNTDTNKEVVS